MSTLDITGPLLCPSHLKKLNFSDLWLTIWIQPGMLTLRYEPTQRDMFTVNLKRSHGEGMRAAQNRRLDAPMFPRNLSHQATLKKKKNQKADLVVHHEHKH